ncbi:hypothetical protein BH18ACT4_BH18ACT4_05000 [soil metagenome]
MEPASTMPPVRPLRPSPGLQMNPQDIVGRAEAVARIWDLLERSGATLLLNEPRRIGKTSVLVLLSHAPPDPWLCVRQSFQGVSTTVGLVELALNGVHQQRSLTQRARKAVGAFLAGSKAKTKIEGVEFELALPFRDDPIAALERALHDVDDALGDRRLLLAWDEVPDMVAAIADNEGEAAATQALALLRRFREHGDASIRWLLTGSVGFHHVMRRLGRADLLNDAEKVDLGPLDQPWTRWLSHGLLLGAGIKAPIAPVVDELATASGGIALLVHLAAKEVRDRQLRVLAPGEITGLLDEALGDLDRGHQMTSLLTRLHLHYGDDADLAVWLLDRIATRPHARPELHTAMHAAGLDVRHDDDLRDVLDWLRADHYLDGPIVDGERRYEWRYPALRRIWILRRL